MDYIITGMPEHVTKLLTYLWEGLAIPLSGMQNLILKLPSMVRISVGLEGADNLIVDLNQALKKLP